MRYILIVLLSISFASFAQNKESVVRHIVKLQFDSAWVSSQALSDPKERSTLMKLTTIISHGGQQKGDSLLIADILPSTKDPFNQLLLGNFYLYNGERGKALKYLIRSLEYFKKKNDDIVILNYLSILHLYSRILLSDKYRFYLDEFHPFAKDPYLEAWYLNYKLQYLGKILDTEEIADEYHMTYETARRLFNRYDFNHSIQAHFLEKEAIYFRWTEDYNKSLESFQKTVEFCYGHQFLRFLKFTALIELAGMQIRSGDLNTAKVNIQKAQAEWDYSDPILSELNFNIVMAVNFYEQTKQWDSAYFLIKKIYVKGLEDFFENNNVRITELQEEFNSEIKDSQIENQNNLISTQNNFLLVFTALSIILLLLIGTLVYAFRKIKSKNRKIETLLRELHHRVKNNLQVISSLLGLQSMKLEDKRARKAVKEGKGRIRAMSLIHQKLYQDDDVSKLNIREYLTNLIDELAETYGFKERSLISIRVPERSFDTDTTLPIGLIVNELVTNSFKYAYANVETPMLSIDLKEIKSRKSSDKNMLKLSVSDNGPGLPEHFDLKNAESFGLKLVNLLVKQIRGKIDYFNSEGGSTFEIQFPEKAVLVMR